MLFPYESHTESQVGSRRLLLYTVKAGHVYKNIAGNIENGKTLPHSVSQRWSGTHGRFLSGLLLGSTTDNAERLCLLRDPDDRKRFLKS